MGCGAMGNRGGRLSLTNIFFSSIGDFFFTIFFN